MSSTEQGPPTPSLLSELHFVADKRTSQQCSGPTPSLRPPVLSRSVSVRMSDGCFLSALQPNVSRTAYVLPSDGPSSDPMAKARRVREQVRMRLAEKKSSSLPRLDDSLFGSTDYSLPEEKSFTRTHGFSSRSLIHTPSRIMADAGAGHCYSGQISVESDAALQALGAAYIQHQCYHSNDAKNQVHALHGVPALVQLFSSDNQDVQRYATGAMRNLIYENAKNKAALVDAGGVMSLVRILKEPDEELRKTITGVLWNLSSRDNLKEKLSKEALPELTEKVLIPLCSSLPLSPSERDIFYNTTGCLRNLSSVNERTRQKMRDMQGLVDSLVSYIQQEERGDDKGLENSLCVMRNLSYQLYMELPPSVRLRLEGPVRASASGDSQAISCFTLYSKKNTKHNQNQFLLSEVTQQPRGAEWLWHPKMVVLYKLVLQNSDCNSTSQEAAIGALQNITAGENRWSSVLSGVVMERERMLPILLDLLDTNSDMQQRPLTGLLKNLARHSTNKDHIAKNMVNSLVSKLPSDGLQKTPSSEVVVNICGALNHLVICSSLAARDIVYYNGLQKLVGIKTSHDNSPGSLKAARAASTVLCNMFQYNKLHKDYKLKGFARRDFTDSTI